MNIYDVSLLDTKDHEYLIYTLLAENISEALDIAKEEAYHQMDKKQYHYSLRIC